MRKVNRLYFIYILYLGSNQFVFYCYYLAVYEKEPCATRALCSYHIEKT